MTTEDRLLDLLASSATEGLSETEARELRRLIAEHDDMTTDHFEEAAAAADLALHPSRLASDPIPDALKRRILARADSQMPGVGPTRARAADGAFSARYLGWYAAAAMLVFALWAPWLPRAPWSPRPAAPAEPPATAAAQRAALLEQATDLIRVEWSPPEIAEYAGVTGDVVWSSQRQRGFMRLAGLPRNDPRLAQYQLWIVDPERDARPVDGGVFDIDVDAGEVIVPIDAKLEVGRPAAFAITLEKPGGVVVSAGPLLVVAPVA